MFKGILITKNDKEQKVILTDIAESDLPKNDVIVQVSYSSFNYKDALAITGKAPVVRNFPMIPGIDLAGTVIESSCSKFKIGEAVILNGHGVGEKYWGGLAQKASVSSDWLLKLPKGLSLKEAMQVGTAGYTAMLAVQRLKSNNISPDSGKILVTGASGGLGSFAITFLSKLGYHVVASTGRIEEEQYLKELGAKEVIHRNTLLEEKKPLLKEKWAAAIDSLGSETLVNTCASTMYGGVVCACGLAQGLDFNSTVAPFILRGITLIGIDSVMCPTEERLIAWQEIAKLLDTNLINKITTQISLEETIQTASKLLNGEIRGRILVDLES